VPPSVINGKNGAGRSLINFDKLGMRLVSGIRPSGELTIANYLGALKQWLELQNQYESYFFIADLHALTTPYEPKQFSKTILETLSLYLALGLDPKRSVVFLQSHIPEHTELAWLFSTFTPVGELERMTQYKDKVREGAPAMAGLLSYPVLMAADILLYKANVVPVGEDQIQHIELTREIAKRFNKRFGQIFPLPRPILPPEGAARIRSLQNPEKKMSKSDADPNGAIMLLDTPEEIRRKIKIAVTDSGKEIIYDPKKKPAISNLLVIAAGFSGKSIAELEKEFKGRGYAEFKTYLSDILISKLKPIQEKFSKLLKNPDELKRILDDGKKRSRVIAASTLLEVKQKMGLLM
jgi:tryptophanyl-tRNA synthetase